MTEGKDRQVNQQHDNRKQHTGVSVQVSGLKSHYFPNIGIINLS